MIELINTRKTVCVCTNIKTWCVHRRDDGRCVIPIEILLKEYGCPYRKCKNIKTKEAILNGN